MINPLQREKIKVVNFKITEKDWVKVQRLAKKFAQGNASAWIRKAIMQTDWVGGKEEEKKSHP